MKKILLIIISLWSIAAMGQSKVYIRGDSVEITKVGGSAELIIRNATRGVTGGFLKNLGNGRTGFATVPGSTNTSIGTGFDIGWTGTNNVRRVGISNGLTGDSATTNTVGFKWGGSLTGSTTITQGIIPLEFTLGGAMTTNISPYKITQTPTSYTGTVYNGFTIGVSGTVSSNGKKVATATISNSIAHSSGNGQNIGLRVSALGAPLNIALLIDSGYVGIGEDLPGSKLWLRTNNMHELADLASGIVMSNDSSATVSYDQTSPPLTFAGLAWDTVGNTSRGSIFSLYALPSKGGSSGTTPRGRLQFKTAASIGSDSLNKIFALGESGQMYDYSGNAGAVGEVPISAGPSAGWLWGAASGGGGSGTVTSVATGLGLSGGTITTTGTIIADTSYLVNKSTAQVIAGSKTFTGETRIGSGIDKGTPILQVTGKQYNYGTDETDGGYHLGYVDGSQNTGRIYRDGGTGGMVVENFIAKMTFIASGTGIDMYGASGAPIQLRPQGAGVTIGPSASTPTALLHVQAGTTSFPSQVIVEGAKTTVAIDGAIEKDDAFYMTKTNAVRYGVGGTLKTNYTDVGNVGGGEDDLMSFSVPAGTLSQDGDYLEFEMVVQFFTANSKSLKVYFGGTTMVNFGGTAVAFITIRGTVIRTGATTQKYNVTTVTSSGTYAFNSETSTASETLSGAITLKATGTGVADNDIIQKTLTVKYFPAN